MGDLLDGLTRAAQNGGHAADLAREVTLPLAQGIRAFAESDYQTAADQFDGIAEQLPRIGGSHAQREVFEDTILEARIRAGRFDEAQNMLHTRLKRRTSVPRRALAKPNRNPTTSENRERQIPRSLYGLAGAGFDFRLSGEGRSG